MYYAAIKPTDVANGPGIRVSLFVSGCTHYCKDCFNSEAWDFCYGNPFTQDSIEEILCCLDHSYIAGLSLLGGEPLHPDNLMGVLSLAERVKARFPHQTIWCYTGYELERELLDSSREDQGVLMGLLNCIDVLVDGRFLREKKDLNLRFKGSSNQRVIKLPETLKTGEIVLWE